MGVIKKSLDTSVQVKEFLLAHGASVAGIAKASAFDGAPNGYKAVDVLCGAESVIVFGIKMVSAVVNWPQLAWEDSRQTKRKCWRVYDQCGFTLLNDRLSHLGMDLAVALELDESQAIFFAGSNPLTMTEFNADRFYGGIELPQPLDNEKINQLKNGLENPTRYDVPFSFRHAAVAAGLAAFGANNLVLHPIFGPRIRWNVVITDRQFEQYDRPLDKQMCLYDKGCRACIKACPYGVFGEVGEFKFAGMKFPWSKMSGKCYANSLPCGGTCLQVCPAGTGDKQMKKLAAKRFQCVLGQ